ncbi:MAG: polymerase, sigma-24 subunit, subfamily [Acidobacteriales bacterium]|nr:polymerase, sigma-24 subunit, subfamily [Terriglobales bacterium]
MKRDEHQPKPAEHEKADRDPMTNSLPDEDLMFHVRNGVGESLGVLFDRYQDPLFNFYCRLTGDRTVSEDLVQDVFYRILKYRQTYRPGTSFRTWMYQIARNARLDSLRKEKVQVPLEFDITGPQQPDRVQQEQETALLHKALMQLPEEKREILVLSRFQELKYEEIAQLLGCEVGAVKVRVFRALKELRTAFQELESQGASTRSLRSQS